MKKKIIGIFVCTLLIITAGSAVGTMNIGKTTNGENRMPLQEDDYDWQVSGNNVITGHGGSYPSGYVGIGATSPSEELHIRGMDGCTAVRLVEATGVASIWELQSLDDGDGNYFTIYGGETGYEGYHFVINPDYGVAMGNGNTVSGYSSTAMGFKNTVSGQRSTAMGRETTASGVESTAMGAYTKAIGNGSTAMGASTKAIGDISTAMGYSTEAIGDISTAMGRTITVEGDHSVGIGLDPTAYTVTSNNVMSIMGGNVGIGTTSPSYLLHVAGGSGLVAQFSGRVKGADAVNDDEFVTRGQVKSKSVIYYTPTGTSDPYGNIGSTAWDANYFYVKTKDGWKRAALETWESALK